LGCIKSAQLYNLSWFNLVGFSWLIEFLEMFSWWLFGSKVLLVWCREKLYTVFHLLYKAFEYGCNVGFNLSKIPIFLEESLYSYLM